MVRASYDQKPYRRILMETYGAEVVASPSLTTNYGRTVLGETPDSPGSLGMAISEAVEDAATRDDTKYALGLGAQPRAAAPDGDRPGGHRADGRWPASRRTSSSACTGGGSNFAGLTFPFLGRNFREGAKHRDHRRRARGGPEPDPRRLRLRLRRHRQDDAARQDAHARLTTSSPSRSMPAGCATTAWRRWSACSRSTA